MPYVEAITRAGKTVEVEKYYTSIWKKPGMKRAERKKPTKEEQEKINSRHAEKKLRRKINANFVGGDYHLVLNYDPNSRPENKDEMRQNINVFLRKLRGEYKKLGKELKYIHVMEIGKRGALHHHLIINAIDPKIITKAWRKGRYHIHPLDATGQYEKLASYFVKQSDKNLKRECKLQGKRWDSSKNLITPVTKKRIIPVKYGFRNDVKPKKGYYIEKDSVKQGINEYTGYPFLTYTMIEIDTEELRN